VSKRIRSIKPEILEDALTAGLSDRAWRLFVSSWLLADDGGNLRGDVRYVRGAVFWAREEVLSEDVEAALTELTSKGFLTPYEVREQRYFAVRGWSKHQKIDRPSRSRIPTPSDAIGAERAESCEDTREPSRVSSQSDTSGRECTTSPGDEDREPHPQPGGNTRDRSGSGSGSGSWTGEGEQGAPAPAEVDARNPKGRAILRAIRSAGTGRKANPLASCDDPAFANELELEGDRHTEAALVAAVGEAAGSAVDGGVTDPKALRTLLRRFVRNAKPPRTADAPTEAPTPYKLPPLRFDRGQGVPAPPGFLDALGKVGGQRPTRGNA
jgi:hypothetical protein